MTPNELSSIVRETFVEPDAFESTAYHVRQVTALLKASHMLKKPLNTVKAFGIPWSFLQRSKEMFNTMTSLTKACRHLAIEFNMREENLDTESTINKRADVRPMLSNSPFLHTIEISLTYRERQDPKEYALRLPEVLNAGAHWPDLKRLKLQGLKAKSISLVEMLAAHATTLRSLELADIYFESYKRNGKEYHGSWMDMILFLESDLNLTAVRLAGQLCNSLDEVWQLDEPLGIERLSSDEKYLKYRIERFITEGGPCPIQVLPDNEQQNNGRGNRMNYAKDWTCRIFQSSKKLVVSEWEEDYTQGPKQLPPAKLKILSEVLAASDPNCWV